MAGPAVMLANHYQFAAGERVGSPKVQSVMLLWCKAGRGFVTVNGTRFALGPGDACLMPWEHSVGYQSDATRPLLVGGVHLIPRWAQGDPLVLGVAHSPASPLFCDPRCGPRQGWSDDDGLCPPPIAVDLRARPGLELLAEYIVTRFQRNAVAEADARAMGSWLCGELSGTYTSPGGGLGPPEGSPPRLVQLLEHVRSDLSARFDVATMSRFMGVSPATTHRLFATWVGATPMAWLTARRMEEATLLLATSGAPVGAIAERLGVDDPCRFSKLFARHHGMSPSAFRRGSSLIRTPGRA